MNDNVRRFRAARIPLEAARERFSSYGPNQEEAREEAAKLAHRLALAAGGCKSLSVEERARLIHLCGDPTIIDTPYPNHQRELPNLWQLNRLGLDAAWKACCTGTAEEIDQALVSFLTRMPWGYGLAVVQYALERAVRSSISSLPHLFITAYITRQTLVGLPRKTRDGTWSLGREVRLLPVTDSRRPLALVMNSTRVIPHLDVHRAQLDAYEPRAPRPTAYSGAKDGVCYPVPGWVKAALPARLISALRRVKKHRLYFARATRGEPCAIELVERYPALAWLTLAEVSAARPHGAASLSQFGVNFTRAASSSPLALLKEFVGAGAGVSTLSVVERLTVSGAVSPVELTGALRDDTLADWLGATPAVLDELLRVVHLNPQLRRVHWLPEFVGDSQERLNSALELLRSATRSLAFRRQPHSRVFDSASYEQLRDWHAQPGPRLKLRLPENVVPFRAKPAQS